MRNLVNLRELSIEQTGVHNLDPLTGLNDLEELIMTGTTVDSLLPVMHLHNLEKLELSAACVPEFELERFVREHPDCDVVIK